ncbi:MAG TPA: VOC family protein [Thermoanaerobaculia bacterium]|nr:VOC family protein [Thermoanaerobaculia bacterium]
MIKTVILAVKDIDAAKNLYGKLLGVAPVMDQKYYVQYNIGDQEIGLDPSGTAAGIYWKVSDIRTALKSLVEAGAEKKQDVTEVGGGRLIARVADGSGNTIGLLQTA